jgi:Tfp pilus assembly protein PilW
MVYNTTSTISSRSAGLRRRQRSRAGMTTVETLIAIGISVVLLTQVCALWYYSSRSFAAQAAYTALDQDSQRALDRLSKEIRQAQDIRSFANNRIVLKDFDTRDLEYSLSGRSLMRIKNATNGIIRSVLLNNVDSLQFSMYQKTPVEGAWQQYATTNLATCKLIEVRWKCSRKLHPLSPQTTEYMQSAKIVIRSK